MLPLLQRLLQYLPNAEMTLDLEANEVEVKVLTSLASVAEITARLWAVLGEFILFAKLVARKSVRAIPMLPSKMKSSFCG